MRLSVKIMAHPNRSHLIPDLLERLELTEDDVIWDQKQNRWDTGRRAWEAVDQSAEWGAVIQDDALVCADFIPGVEKALEYIPQESLFSPYVGTRRPMSSRVERAVHEAIAKDAVFIKMPSLNWGVAIMAPTRIIDGMLPWCDTQTYPNYDRRIGRYAIDVLRYATWCSWPSLVDHREVPSLVGHGGGRVAHHFIGEDASALDIDWSKGFVHMDASRTSARHQASGAVRPFGAVVTGTRGYRPARSLRVPKANLFQSDTPPSRPERSG